MDERFKTIANHYGLLHQLVKLGEEAGELKEAVFGFMDKSDNIDHLQEEIADVKVVIAQVEYLLGVDSTIKKYETAKIERQLERIRNEETSISDNC